MSDLSNTLEGNEARSAGKIFLEQIIEIYKANLALIKDPLLLPKGMVKVWKDCFYEPVRAVITKDNNVDEDPLGKKLSQALALGEVAEIPGSIFMVYVFKYFGADDYTAGVVGGTLGDYIFSVSTFVLSYISLTRSVESYSVKDAFKQTLKTIRNVLPAAAGIYSVEGPFVAALTWRGVGPTVANVAKYAFFMSLLAGAGRQVSGDNITSQYESARPN